MIGKIVAVAALACAPFAWSAASATDAQDAYFESCVQQYVARNMGTPDAAAAYCYGKAYGSETSGGGQSNIPTPVPPALCYGDCDFGNTNPQFREQMAQYRY